MKQRSLGDMPIAIGDRMRLLVGPNLELAARQLTVAVRPNEVSRENVYAGMIEPIIDSLAPAIRLYLLGDPETAPVFVYGFLEARRDRRSPPGRSKASMVSRSASCSTSASERWIGVGGWFNPGV